MTGFEDIRSILQRPASSQTWEAFVEASSQIQDAVALEDVYIPYAQGILSRWPAHVRRYAPRTWFLRKSGYRVRSTISPLFVLADTFHLSQVRTNTFQLKAMIRDVPWENMTGVDLERTYIDAEAACLLATQPPQNLELFRLAAGFRNRKSKLLSKAEALIKSSSFGGMAHLDLSNQGIGTMNADRLFKKDIGSRLRTLNLGGNRMDGQAGVKGLVACEWLPQLTHLDLSYNGFTEANLEILSHAENLSGLMWLSFRGNRALKREHLERLLPHIPNLSYLDVSETDMWHFSHDDHGLVDQGRFPTWSQRHDLTLQEVAATYPLEDDPS